MPYLNEPDIQLIQEAEKLIDGSNVHLFKTRLNSYLQSASCTKRKDCYKCDNYDSVSKLCCLLEENKAALRGVVRQEQLKRFS